MCLTKVICSSGEIKLPTLCILIYKQYAAAGACSARNLSRHFWAAYGVGSAVKITRKHRIFHYVKGIVQNMDWTGLDNWTGQLDWTVGLDNWTGQLDWTAGLDSWTGLLDWDSFLLNRRNSMFLRKAK